MKNPIAIRIEVNEKNNIFVKRINIDRFSFHGFGSFIWSIKPEEISIHPQALEILKTRIGYSYTRFGDLAGLSMVFSSEASDPRCRGFYLNYGFLGYELEIPLEDIILDRAFYEMLKSAQVEEKTWEVDVSDRLDFDLMVKLEEEGNHQESNKIYKKYQKTFFPNN